MFVTHVDDFFDAQLTTIVGAFVVCTTSVEHRRTTAGSNPRFQSRPKLLAVSLPVGEFLALPLDV